MSIQPLDEQDVAPSAGDTSSTLYVPDGIYNAPDTPDNDCELKSPSTVDISAQSASDPVAVDVFPTSLAPRNDIPNAKLCGVCKEKQFKYKCSRCYLPYCSIACSIVHKAVHPLPAPPITKPLPTAPPKPSTTAPRAGTAAAAGLRSPFSALDTSPELQALFKHYPKLHVQLTQIHTAMQPPSKSSPDVYEKLTGRHNHQKAWNQERGLEKGREALDRAREAWGKDGEGIREYGELILRIVGGVDADELVRKELERENARIVKALLDGEM